jgi:DNA-binding NarL/FixJ family response regulator
VVELMQEGLSNKEIARHLNIRPATVKNHVHHILEKLQVRRRGEAVALLRRAPRNGSFAGGNGTLEGHEQKGDRGR